MMNMAMMTRSREFPGTNKMKLLESELREWWEQERTDWDTAVTGAEPKQLPGGADLWDAMPTLDSKAVARTSPIFERHLGAPLDVKLIRPGGYSSIEDFLKDLLPKIKSAAQR
jgi:hypothetical protein